MNHKNMKQNLNILLSPPFIKKTDIAHFLCIHYNKINLADDFYWIWDGEEISKGDASNFINNVITKSQKITINKNPVQVSSNHLSDINNDCPIISKGMENFGNVCYMSSALQMLYSCKYFRDTILKLNIESIQPSQNDKKVVESIKNIFEKLNTKNNEKVINYQTEYDNFFKIVMKTESNNKIQQDSTEFLTNLLDIFKECNISNIFNHVQKTYTYFNPKNLNTKSPTIESNAFLQIQLNKETNITSIINEYMEEETLNTPIQNGNVFRTLKIIKISIPEDNKYLLINLKRFSYTEITKNTGTKKFLSTKVEIENDIVISSVKYKLIGAIIYTGNNKGERGHYIYITFCENKIYYIYNDSHAMNATNIDDLRYKTLINTNAYIILYERIYNSL
jgi:ubiquitin C-terminal hydrolase